MDKKGVSVLVGFILLMLTLMIFLSILQAYMIPSMCKDVETKKLNKLVEEIQKLDSDIVDNKLTTVTLDLGIRYPKYPMLMSPPPMASTVKVDSFAMRISYEEILPNGSIVQRNNKFYSNRIVIIPNYFYNRNDEIMLENTAILRLKKKNNQEELLFSILDQQMFTQNGIRITLINATFRSFSATQPVDVAIVPISYGGFVVVRNVTVEFKTSCPEYWNDIKHNLEEIGYNVSLVGNNTVIIHYPNSTKLEISYALLFKGVSITVLQYENLQQYESLLKPYRIIPTNPTTNYTLKVGESIVLGVKVLDRFNNPVRGLRINVSLNGVGYILYNTTYTNSNGESFTTYVAATTGSAIVNFSASFGWVKYLITIPATSGRTVTSVVYDANTTTTTVTAYGNYTDTNPPTTYDIIPNTQFASVDPIKSVDDDYLISVAPYGYYSAQKFVFTGLSTENVISTEIFWYGNGTGYIWSGGGGKSKWLPADGVSIYVWNYNTSKYELIGYSGSSSLGWVPAVVYPQNLGDYIENGEMTILIVQNGYEDSKLYTDYIGIFQIFK